MKVISSKQRKYNQTFHSAATSRAKCRNLKDGEFKIKKKKFHTSKRHDCWKNKSRFFKFKKEIKRKRIKKIGEGFTVSN